MDIELIAWVLLRDADGRVLLARRSGTSIADGLWNLPGGHIEDGERAAVAAAREAREEIGAILDPAALRHIGLQRFDLTYSSGRATGFNFFFETDTWDGDLAPGEVTSELGWFDVDDIPADSLPWLQGALIRHCVDRVWYAEDVDPSPGP
ncbi:MAG: NUDIX domain-containing protein [Propionibacteriaceae bacterium]|nr:NUDIX domain-containing protein [Propionibacteriaceae bacterium]